MRKIKDFFTGPLSRNYSNNLTKAIVCLLMGAFFIIGSFALFTDIMIELVPYLGIYFLVLGTTLLLYISNFIYYAIGEALRYHIPELIHLCAAWVVFWGVLFLGWGWWWLPAEFIVFLVFIDLTDDWDFFDSIREAWRWEGDTWEEFLREIDTNPLEMTVLVFLYVGITQLLMALASGQLF
jgi:hypothetical protein